jgi:hypothetical protein
MSEHYSNFFNPEELVQDPSVKSALRSARASLDNLYAGIAEHTHYDRTHYGSVVTESGDFIEANRIGLPMPTDPGFNSPEYKTYIDKLQKMHHSYEYLVFISPLRNVDNLVPVKIDPSNITEYLGGGIYIKLPDYNEGEGALLVLPQMPQEVITFNNEPGWPISPEWIEG